MKHSLLLALITISSFNLCGQGDVPFITTWETANVFETITIPVQPGLTYLYDIDWGDGNKDLGLTTTAAHTYDNAGSHTISITGQYPAIYLNNFTEAFKLLTIEQWGNIAWESMDDAFYGAINLEYNAADIPDLSNVTNMNQMFRDATMFNGDIGSWDVSNITHFISTFRSATSFNRDIGDWDVSSAERINGMFFNAENFNQDIGVWGNDLSNVVDMNFMFYLADDFNQDISDWDVSDVTNMAGMFREAISFDQDLGSWDIGMVTNMDDMLHSCNLSIGNYDKLLHRWAQQNVQSGVTLGAMGVSFCVSQEARGLLTSPPNNWTITDGGQDCTTPRPFITTWQTDHPGSGSTSIIIPMRIFGANNSIDIDWENDGIYDEIGVTGSDFSHDYGAAGTYQVAIRGDALQIQFIDRGDKEKIISIDQWGSTKWRNMDYAFEGCRNLAYDAIDTPDLSDVNRMSNMFEAARIFNGDISSWNTSNVEDMGHLFYGAIDFDQDISDWDVSNVTDMSDMFGLAFDFNNGGVPLDWANTSKVENMMHMFYRALSFNQDVSSWSTSQVEDMRQMFWQAEEFNQDVSDWNTEQVTNMRGMFEEAVAFNNGGLPLDWSSTSKVEDLRGMFEDATAFDQDVSAWSLDSARILTFMFDGATSFNNGGVALDWTNTSSVERTLWMFQDASSFDQDISDWDVSGVTSMTSMFSRASSFNNGGVPLDWANTSKLESIGSMFFEAVSFDQDISTWSTAMVNNMRGMFSGATAFNQNIDGWDVSSVIEMSDMFRNAISFNQPLNSWNIGSVEDLGNIFEDATSFNQDLSGWGDKLSNVTRATRMFEGATSFNQNIGGWIWHNITSMTGMFNDATSFDQDIGDWNIGGVLSLQVMLTNSGISQYNYD